MKDYQQPLSSDPADYCQPTVIRMPKEDQVFFARMVADPTEVSPALAKAFKLRRKWLGEQPEAGGTPVDMNGYDTQEVNVSHLKEAVLARAAKPSKAVAKVVAVRIKTDNYAILAQAAKDEGVKVGELVRAAIDELCEQLAAKE